MVRRVRLGGLVDVALIDDPALIRSLSEDVRLDRDFDGPGPLANRWLLRRVRRTLQVGGTPLPAVASRYRAGRAAARDALEARLDRLLASSGAASEQAVWLSGYVRGHGDQKLLGPKAQEAVGRLFAPDFVGTEATWDAAKTLDAAPRNFNPVRALRWMITGAVNRARQTLGDATENDPAAVHATGVAIHNLVRSVELMRDLWRTPGMPRSISPEAAAARCLRAPASVLRRWSAMASTVAGEMPQGGLAVFLLDAARAKDGGTAPVFMTESWSRCPAQSWTAALLAEIWRGAQAADAQP